MNRLLERQLAKFCGDAKTPPQDWEAFVAAVGNAYDQATKDRLLLERSMDLASAELLERNAQLRKQIEERERMESELRLAHRLESVGHLAAGIAHEINTPVQYIGDSIRFLSEGVGDVLKLLEKLQLVAKSVVEGEACTDAAKAVLSAEDELDLPFLVDNIPRALDRSLAGLDRVATIVRSMKEFAQPAQTEKAPVDINRSIETVLVIAHNEYKYTADVETNLGEIPTVNCLVSDVNQAILNVLVNAAQAIREKVGDSGERGRIVVSTARDGDDVVISVADTGAGIPDDVRDKIFDPFFTTKEPGKGVGQGLAIARTIIESRHQGKITCESRAGEGATFFIRLPIG